MQRRACSDNQHLYNIYIYIYIYILYSGTSSSIADTLGTEIQYVRQRFPLFTGYFYTHATVCLDPQEQSVIKRFPLLGEFVIRGSTEVHNTGYVGWSI